jgi:hypothetical protein
MSHKKAQIAQKEMHKTGSVLFGMHFFFVHFVPFCG